MFSVSLGSEGARLCPLEPRHAEEFLAHLDRGRKFIGQYIGLADRATDLDASGALLRAYADKAATDTGATQAARVIIDWAVENRGAHRVEWQVKAGNLASIAVARRLGMTRDGILREAVLHRGERFDLEVWSVLAPEWRAQHL